MAKKKTDRNIKVKALVNLKYDKDVIKAGKDFLIREADQEAMKDYTEFIEKIEVAPDNDGKQDGEGTPPDGE